MDTDRHGFSEATWQTRRKIPLTPALSQRERGNYRQSGGEGNAFRIREKLPRLFPRPWPSGGELGRVAGRRRAMGGEHPPGCALSGRGRFIWAGFPGRCPGLESGCAFGAEDGGKAQQKETEITELKARPSGAVSWDGWRPTPAPKPAAEAHARFLQSGSRSQGRAPWTSRRSRRGVGRGRDGQRLRGQKRRGRIAWRWFLRP